MVARLRFGGQRQERPRCRWCKALLPDPRYTFCSRGCWLSARAWSKTWQLGDRPGRPFEVWRDCAVCRTPFLARNARAMRCPECRAHNRRRPPRRYAVRCGVCRRPFWARRRTMRYCSPGCRQAADKATHGERMRRWRERRREQRIALGIYRKRKLWKWLRR